MLDQGDGLHHGRDPAHGVERGVPGLAPEPEPGPEEALLPDAGRARGRRLGNQAVAGGEQPGAEQVADAAAAGLLVADEGEADPPDIETPLDRVAHGSDHRGAAPLHVRRAAPVHVPVPDLAAERVEGPGLAERGDDVQVPAEQEVGPEAVRDHVRPLRRLARDHG